MIPRSTAEGLPSPGSRSKRVHMLSEEEEEEGQTGKMMKERGWGATMTMKSTRMTGM